MSDIYTHTHTQYMYISIPNMYENNLTFFGINFEGNMGQSPFFLVVYSSHLDTISIVFLIVYHDF